MSIGFSSRRRKSRYPLNPSIKPTLASWNTLFRSVASTISKRPPAFSNSFNLRNVWTTWLASWSTLTATIRS
ncbi:hypothetical protein DMI60_25105 [Escherichia coli]|nr:hypothetical protein [Escherichia coli]